jgi:hypothetical protein
MPGSSKPSPSHRFPPLKPCMHLFSPPYVLHVLPISVFLIWSPEWYLVRITEHNSSSLCSFLHYPVTSSLLGPNILLSTLCSKTLSLHSSHNVSAQVSQPYKTTGKIIDLCILISTLLDSKLEDKRSSLNVHAKPETEAIKRCNWHSNLSPKLNE